MKTKLTLLLVIIFSTAILTKANAKELENSSFNDKKNYVREDEEKSGIAKNFEGPAISMGLSLTGYSSKYDWNRASPARNNQYSLGQNSVNAVSNLSYLKAVGNNWLLGGGVSYDLNSSSTGGVNDDASPGYKNSTKSSQHFSVYFQPTYALSEKTSIFAKVGYHSTKISLSDKNGILYEMPNFNKRIGGIGYGFGIMTFLDKNIFLKTEIEFVDYSKTRVYFPTAGQTLNYRLTSASGIASIGYRF